LGGEVGRLAVVGKARTIQIIEPIPLLNPSDSSSSDKTRTKASPRKVKEVHHQQRERTKAERISQNEKTRRKEESNSSLKSKSSKKPSTSKTKQDWSLKSPTKTHPSSLVKYYDNEYDRLTNKPEASKSRRPSK